jgi:hypothetical protein
LGGRSGVTRRALLGETAWCFGSARGFGADLFYARQNRFADEVRALVVHAPTPIHEAIAAAHMADKG